MFLKKISQKSVIQRQAKGFKHLPVKSRISLLTSERRRQSPLDIHIWDFLLAFRYSLNILVHFSEGTFFIQTYF